MEIINQHRVTNASIEEPEVDLLFNDGKKAYLLYSDPPWGDGNVKYWATINKRQTGKVYTPLTYAVIIDRIASFIDRFVSGYVFIEVGNRWLEETIQKLNLHNQGVASIRYRSGANILDNKIIYGSTSPEYPPLALNIEGLVGIAAVRGAFESVPDKAGKIAFDPCCGLGNTARLALAHGMEFRGNEFNAKRLEKTKALLR